MEGQKLVNEQKGCFSEYNFSILALAKGVASLRRVVRLISIHPKQGPGVLPEIWCSKMWFLTYQETVCPIAPPIII